MSTSTLAIDLGADLISLEAKEIITKIGLTEIDIEAFRALRLTDSVLEIAQEAEDKIASLTVIDPSTGESSIKAKDGLFRSLAKRNDTGAKINPYLVSVRPDWNCRDRADLENIHHLIGLAKSIAENGVKNPITVAQDGDKLYVTDGHTRLAATFIANNYFGAEVSDIPCNVEARYSSEADHVLSQLVRNEGKKPSALERAGVAKRLFDFGWSEEKIAKKTGYSTARVVQLLELHSAPEAVKAMIRNHQISATEAGRILHGATSKEAAANEIIKAINKAKTEGKTKATARHLDPTKGRAPNARTFFKTIFESVSSEIDNSHDDKVVVTFTLEQFEEIRNLLSL